MPVLSSSSQLLVSVALTTVIFEALRRHIRWRTRLCGFKLPPGPRGWPLLRNTLDFPTTFPWVGLRDMSSTYGNMMFLYVLNTPMLVVSSPDITMDLLEKRSAIYSDRLSSVMDELTGWDMNIGIMPYGERWRGVRSCFHQWFNASAGLNYRAKQTAQIHAFLRRSLDQPGKQLDLTSIHLTLAAITLDVIYGLQVQGVDDAHVKLIEEAASYFIESRAVGAFWVDFIPLLKYVPSWIPGAAAAKFGERCRPVVREMVESPFTQIASGTNENSSLVRDMLERLRSVDGVQSKDIKEQSVKEASGVAYVVAVDTTKAVLKVFFGAMAMSPDIRKKAQKELDLVVGSDRLPTHEDFSALPYVHAILLECLRWFPVVPLSVPHRLIADDYYNGVFIPEGTLVIPNVWQMLRDPQDYPEPEKFNPDRFIQHGVLDRNVRDPTSLIFGFGRRICPGRHFAQDILLLIMASVMHVFDILPSLDESGNELDPKPVMTGGAVLSEPDRNNYMLRVRSEAAERLIQSSVEID